MQVEIRAEPMGADVGGGEVVPLTAAARALGRRLLAREARAARCALRLEALTGQRHVIRADHRRDDDIVQRYESLQVVIDPASAAVLEGATLDCLDPRADRPEALEVHRPLRSFLQAQVDAIADFFADPARCMLAVQAAPDSRAILLRLLFRLERGEELPPVLQVVNTSYRGEAKYFAELLAEIEAQNAPFRPALAEQGVELPYPPEGSRLPARNRFRKYFTAAATSLEGFAGAYVIIVDPAEIADEAAFRRSMVYAATHTRGGWAKYLVLDRLERPILGELPRRTSRGSILAFTLPSADGPSHGGEDEASAGSFVLIPGRTLG